MKMKFDKDLIKRHIDVFFEDKGRDPYMICNQETYNMLPDPIFVSYTNAYNILRNSVNCDNKEVKCLIDLGSHIDVGTYEIVEINVDDGTAQVIEGRTPQIDWLIGEMKADSVTHAQIILKGGEVGLNDISIEISDFLTGGNYHFCQRACTCEKPKYSNITIYKPAEGDVYDKNDIIEVKGYLLDDDDEPINNQTVKRHVFPSLWR